MDAMNAAGTATLARRAWCAALDLLYPRECAACGDVLAEPDGAQMCRFCLANLPRVRGQACMRCGLPLGPYADDHEGRYCEGCRMLPFAGFKRTVAVGTYEGTLRRVIGRFKYDRRPHLVKTLGALVAERAREEYGPAGDAPEGCDEKPDIVLGVPLHAARKRARTFDQAELLAGRAARAIGRPLGRGVIVRVVNTPTLTRQSREERAETVKGAFMVLRPEAVKDRRVLLVDDVMTTGATCSECARALRKAGAKETSILVLARTV